MAITNGYFTLAEFKAHQGVKSFDTLDDAVIEDTAEGVCRDFDRLSGRRFYADSMDATRYYTAKEANCLKIDDLSAAPTSVSVDYTEGQESYTVLTSTQYYLEPTNALLDGLPYREIYINPINGGYFPKSRRGVKVIGKFGFPAVPDNVRQACLDAAVARYKSRFGENMQSTATITGAGVVLTPKFGFTDQAMQTIKSYRFNT